MARTSNNKKQARSSTTKARVLRFAGSRTGMTLIGGILVVAACSGTVAAANSSKPGDLLYGVDIAAEKVRLALSFTNGMKIAAHRSMAQERLQELQDLFKAKHIDASGIAVALSAFEQQKQAATSLSKGTADATNIKDELASYQSEIDKLFEKQQVALEQQRESLKQQAEAADKASNTSLAAQLRTQAGTLDSQLKTLEVKRETSKQEQEKYAETLKAQEEAKSNESSSNAPAEVRTETQHAAEKQQEALTEAVKQEVEAQQEAAKKAQEQAQEQQKEDTQKQSDD